MQPIHRGFMQPIHHHYDMVAVVVLMVAVVVFMVVLMAVVVVLIGEELYSANVGDSGAIIGGSDETAVALTRVSPAPCGGLRGARLGFFAPWCDPGGPTLILGKCPHRTVRGRVRTIK